MLPRIYSSPEWRPAQGVPPHKWHNNKCAGQYLFPTTVFAERAANAHTDITCLQCGDLWHGSYFFWLLSADVSVSEMFLISRLPKCVCSLTHYQKLTTMMYSALSPENHTVVRHKTTKSSDNATVYYEQSLCLQKWCYRRPGNFVQIITFYLDWLGLF